MSLSWIALVVACLALGLAIRTYLGFIRLRRDFDHYDPNPVYGGRRR